MLLAWTQRLWGSWASIIGSVSWFICVDAQFTLALPGFPRCSTTLPVRCEAKVQDFFFPYLACVSHVSSEDFIC